MAELSDLVAEGEALGILGGVANGIPFATETYVDDAIVDNRSDPVFSVLDYGAVGDGVAVDTVAVQACVAAAPEGATIYFPARPGDVSTVYKTGQITLKNNQRLLGAAHGGGTDTGGGVNLQLATNANVSLIKVPVGVSGVVIENLGMYAGPQSGGTVHGIEFEVTVDPGQLAVSLVRNCFIRDFPDDGVHVGHWQRMVTVQDCYIIRCTNGVMLDGSDSKVIGCTIGDHDNACVEDRSVANRVIGSDLYDSPYGIFCPNTYAESSRGCSYIGNHFNDNQTSAVHVLAGKRNIVGNEFQGNSEPVDGVGRHVYVGPGVEGVVISANQFAYVVGDESLVEYDIYLDGATAKAIAVGNYHDPLGSVNGACNRPENLLGLSKSVSHTATAASVVNSTTETTVATWNVPRFVQAGDLLRFCAVGDLLNNSGGNVAYTFRLKLDGTTILSGAATLGTNANRRGVDVRADMVVLTPATSQRTSVLWSTGNGSFAHNAHFGGTVGMGSAASAVDLTAGKALTLTIQMDVAHASADLYVRAASLGLTAR